ncbi:hypothetical protein [Telmatospirillum sp.]|uniref:hypothetical protein n=1 Tax=Telmatospirillum sp. TaxID=2079197 RepID=UPI002841B58A|nr:hypothetical protein [Telmatospirillum sp.]MDR3439885.1 hypothetical protein [Telmatospirillum sp.]
MGWMDPDNNDGVTLGNMSLADVIGLGLGKEGYLMQALQMQRQKNYAGALAGALSAPPAGSPTNLDQVLTNGAAAQGRTDPTDGTTLAALPSPTLAAQLQQPKAQGLAGVYQDQMTPQQQASVQAHLSMLDVPGALKMIDDITSPMPTDAAKNAAIAYGWNTPDFKRAMAGVAKKASSNIMDLRPGGTAYDALNNQPLFSAPTTDGGQIGWGPNGPVMGMVPGAAQVQQTAAYAKSAGQGLAEPQTAYVNGQPVFTNRTMAAGGNLLQNAALGSPQASGAPMAPQGMQGAAQVAAGRFSGYSPAGSAQIAPAPAPGYVTGQEGLAKANTDRYSQMVTSAADSPMRVNVLDNIINLSQQGVNSGPGAEWTNMVKGYVANAPGLSSVLGKWKDDAAGFQELQKFTYQNAQRAWQAAGGTGTDAQMESFAHSNPNDKLFPQALQSIAQWGKGGELALQAKTNAADQFLAQNGGDTSKMNQFENAWRKNFDPRVWQMKAMDPSQLANFTAPLSQSDRAQLLQKYQTAKMNGWIQ